MVNVYQITARRWLIQRESRSCVAHAWPLKWHCLKHNQRHGGALIDHCRSLFGTTRVKYHKKSVEAGFTGVNVRACSRGGLKGLRWRIPATGLLGHAHGDHVPNNMDTPRAVPLILARRGTAPADLAAWSAEAGADLDAPLDDEHGRWTALQLAAATGACARFHSHNGRSRVTLARGSLVDGIGGSGRRGRASSAYDCASLLTHVARVFCAPNPCRPAPPPRQAMWER